MITYPKIESIANKIKILPCVDIDRDIFELYGTHSPILNKGRVRVALAYYYGRQPSDDEMDAGIAIVEARFNAWKEANR
jgi:hypothetical protein